MSTIFLDWYNYEKKAELDFLKRKAELENEAKIAIKEAKVEAEIKIEKAKFRAEVKIEKVKAAAEVEKEKMKQKIGIKKFLDEIKMEKKIEMKEFLGDDVEVENLVMEFEGLTDAEDKSEFETVA